MPCIAAILVGSSPENGTSPIVYLLPALLADLLVLLADADDVGLLLLPPQPAAAAARAPTAAQSATRRIAVLIFTSPLKPSRIQP
jgi:hypothetical protein